MLDLKIMTRGNNPFGEWNRIFQKSHRRKPAGNYQNEVFAPCSKSSQTNIGQFGTNGNFLHPNFLARKIHKNREWSNSGAKMVY
ncbi:MAG: hypothetical protein ACE5GM_02375 [bacterium]